MPTLLSGEHNYHHPGSLAGCRLIPALALSPPWPAEPVAAWHPGDLPRSHVTTFQGRSKGLPG